MKLHYDMDIVTNESEEDFLKALGDFLWEHCAINGSYHVSRSDAIYSDTDKLHERNPKLDADPRLAYNEHFGFYYFKDSSKMVALLIDSQK
jgi:hypothetical protein